jgi:hypothetical protein
MVQLLLEHEPTDEQRLATDGTIVTQGMPVLRYTINGIPLTIPAHESGVLTHLKHPGDTIVPDDALFTVRGERRGRAMGVGYSMAKLFWVRRGMKGA